jgi:hypothetical protein
MVAENVVVNSFNPSTCAGAVITSTLWDCEVATNFVVPMSGSAEWRVFIDIPATSPLTFLRQGFFATSAPNVQITGAGSATIPNTLVQGGQRSIQDAPPQPSMTLSGSSPTGNISRGVLECARGAVCGQCRARKWKCELQCFATRG